VSIEAIRWAFEQRCPSSTTKTILVALAYRANGKPVCWPSLSTIATDCGLSRKNVPRYIRQLVEAGLIAVRRRTLTGAQSNEYVLCMRTQCPHHEDNLSSQGEQGVSSEGYPNLEVRKERETAYAVSGHSEERDHGKSNGKGSRIPEGWQPRAEDIGFAVSLGLDPGAVTDEFTDYWRGVPGSRGLKSDWGATFRNSCRKTAERAGAGYRGGGGRGEPAARPGTITHAVNAILTRSDVERRGR
jgi:hypothetical protein